MIKLTKASSPCFLVLFLVSFLIGIFFQTGEAWSTMPMLTEMPKSISSTNCQRWASKQGEDALHMWGTQETGGTNRTLGLSRLTSHCLGTEPPDIVFFYSSVGTADAYCDAHRAAKICAGR